MDSTEVLAVARRILSTQTLGFLATVGKSSPSIRMVGALVVDDDLRVAFATSAKTRKVLELRTDPRAVYATADMVPGDLTTGSAVCLYGTASIDADSPRRREIGARVGDRYFPGGAENPDFVIVTLAPDRVEVWSEQDRIVPDPHGMASAVVTRSARGWSEPTTTYPDWSTMLDQ